MRFVSNIANNRNKYALFSFKIAERDVDLVYAVFVSVCSGIPLSKTGQPVLRSDEVDGLAIGSGVHS